MSNDFNDSIFIRLLYYRHITSISKERFSNFKKIHQMKINKWQENTIVWLPGQVNHPKKTKNTRVSCSGIQNNLLTQACLQLKGHIYHLIYITLMIYITGAHALSKYATDGWQWRVEPWGIRGICLPLNMPLMKFEIV